MRPVAADEQAIHQRAAVDAVPDHIAHNCTVVAIGEGVKREI